MSQYYGNQTSDLSASMTSSSIASDVQEISSVFPSVPSQNISSEVCSDFIGSDKLDQNFVNILTILFNKGSYEAVLEIADELLQEHPK